MRESFYQKREEVSGEKQYAKMAPENDERCRSECDRGENVLCLCAPFVRIRNLKQEKEMKQKQKMSLGALIIVAVLALVKAFTGLTPETDTQPPAALMQQTESAEDQQAQEDLQTQDMETPQDTGQSEVSKPSENPDATDESGAVQENSNTTNGAWDSQESSETTAESWDSQENAETAAESWDSQENTETGQTNLTFRNKKLLDQHYKKHGIEMGFSSAKEYEQAAAAVVSNPEVLHKTEAEDGDDVYYVESTNEFVIVSTDGYIRTYFYPRGGLSYYNRQ